MNYMSLIAVFEVLIVIIAVLLSVAFVTVAERKTMASMQRRLGPNVVGFYGSLQAFADALKLILKEYVSPAQANIILFFLGPIITLNFALLGYLVIPFGVNLVLADLELGIFYLLAVSSLSTYGILLAGWSANSKYAFLGSLRSTAQLISYELVLSSGILLVIMLVGSLNIMAIIESQRSIWYIFPLFPLFIIIFIGSVAETNRAPFDLAEAESELVSGFMTEHAAVIFVFFFLAEYASIVLICILNSILFLGGYLSIDTAPLYMISGYLYDALSYCIIYIEVLVLYSINTITSYLYISISALDVNVDSSYYNQLLSDLNLNMPKPTLDKIFNSYCNKEVRSPLSLAIKSSILIFVFIWVRASFPRIRYDQLMSYCWTMLLPILISFILLVPCILYSFQIIPVNIRLL